MAAWAGKSAAAEIITNATRVFGLGSLNGAVLSANGTRLATFGQSGAFIWDFQSGTVQHRLEAHRAAVTHAVFSRDGSLLLTAGRDGSIRVWNSVSGQLLHTITGFRREVTGLSFASDGRPFVASSSDGTVQVRSAETGALIHSLELGVWIHTVVFAPDSDHFAISEGQEISSVRLWRAGSNTPVADFKGHSGNVRFLAFLPDGRLVSAADDRTVRIWDATTGAELRVLTGATDTILSISAAADGSLVTAATHGRILAWNPATGELIHSLPAENLFAVFPIPNTSSVLTLHGDNSVRVLALPGGEKVREFSGHASSTISDLSLSPDGKEIVSAAIEGMLRVWDAATAQQVRNIPGAASGSMAARFSPDGTKILTTSAHPHAAILRDGQTGAVQREFLGHSSWLMAAVFSADGKRIATSAQDQTVRVWNADTGEPVWTSSGHESWITALAFSSDGKWLASGSDDQTARLWNAETGALLHTLEGHEAGVKGVVFSPGGAELLTVSEGGGLRFWAPMTGKLVRELSVPAGFLETAAYSPDGQYILTGEGWPFNIARLFDARTLEPLAAFAAATSSVATVAFDPSGLSIVTGGDIVRTWNIAKFAGRLTTRRTAQGLELNWSAGTLQSAPTLAGPWQDVPAAASSHLISPRQPRAFYRVAID